MEVGAHQIQNLNDDGVPNRIEDLIASLTIRNKLLSPQHREMLRDISLLHAKLLDQRSGREFSLAEEFQNSDSGRMSKRLKYISLELSQ